MSPALVVPCSADAAGAWALGLLTDCDLIIRSPALPEAFLVASLPDIRAWRCCLGQMVAYWRQGARLVILRTKTPVVVAHITRIGAVLTCREPAELGGKGRYLVPPAAVDAYLGRMAQYL